MNHTEMLGGQDDLVLNYHLMHPGGESAPGDPNLAYCLDGVFHLHYILRHPWQGGTSYSFIHINSSDMLHWRWLPTKLQPSFTGHGMFSGTGFITKNKKPAAIYCAVGADPPYISVANDHDLSSWGVPYPLLPKGGPAGSNITLLGDPDCFLVGDSYYAYSANFKIDRSNASTPSSVSKIQLCKSNDLVHWTYVGNLLKHDMPGVAIGEDLSCANMFQLGNKWMLLCISHSMGCRYYLGEWDDGAEQFVPDTHGRMNWRRKGQALFVPTYRDFFAPESLLTPDGRRVMWAWLATLGPEASLKTIQSLPRELSLGTDGSLRIDPLRELKLLRSEVSVFEDIMVSDSGEAKVSGENGIQKITELKGDSFEIRITIDRAAAERRRFGFEFFSNQRLEGLVVLICPVTGMLCVGETEAPFSVADLPEREDVDLQIFIDKYLVEVFVNSRQALLTAHFGYRDGGQDFNAYGFFGRGTNPMKIKKIEIWKMKASNKGFLEARDNPVWQPQLE